MGDHQPQPPDINVDALLAAPDGIDALFHALGRLRCSCPPDATHHLAGCSRGYGQAAATVIRRLHQDNEVLQEQLLHWRCSLGDAEDHVFVLLRENKRLRQAIRTYVEWDDDHGPGDVVDDGYEEARACSGCGRWWPCEVAQLAAHVLVGWEHLREEPADG